MRTRILLCCALALSAGAGCERSADTPALRIAGDTLLIVNNTAADSTAQGGQCAPVFSAHVDQPGTEVTIVGGKLTYRFVGGPEALSLSWTANNIKEMWPQNAITQEKPQASARMPLAISPPFRPLEGEAVFQYLVGDEEETRTAEAFKFQCREQ